MAKGDKPCVIIPPLLRCLFSRCCNDTSHCSNEKDKGFAEELLDGYVRLRNELIKQLVSHGLTKFKVMDSCCMTMCSKTAGIAERLTELRTVMANDGTHFLDNSYKKHCHSMHELSPADHDRAQTCREEQLLLLAGFPQPVRFVHAKGSCWSYISWSWNCVAIFHSGPPERNLPWVPF